MNNPYLAGSLITICLLAAAPVATADAAEPCFDAGTASGGSGSITQVEADPDLSDNNATVGWWNTDVYVYINLSACIDGT